ncbi:MAG: right-handed parallel beta-helix repeat-containing protein [Thermoproteota archaeon]|nr:right-handed parallel beta-helix repeat-containing protein [Thermoproteota archaeon]
MQRLVRHRTSMLAVVFIVLVALSFTIMMLITMGQQEEKSSRQEEANLQDDSQSYHNHQLVPSIVANGKAHFGLGIMNPIEHRMIYSTNGNNNNGVPNVATTPHTAGGSPSDNNKNNNANYANNYNTLKDKSTRSSDDTIHTKNNFIDLKNSPATIASCGQLVTTNVILLKDIECDGFGMIVGANGITINLNNHKLSLANHSNAARIPEVEETGILIPNQKNITIMGPGIISGFDKAIEFVGSEKGYVVDAKLTDNNIGISIKVSHDITIYRNFIETNTIGMASQSSRDTLILGNQESQNVNQGMVLMNSNHFIIAANNLIGNGNIGVFLDIRSSNNTLSSNNILNHAIDVSNADGVPIDISNNKYIQNGCGISLPDGLC